jgi:hypothetical protein
MVLARRITVCQQFLNQFTSSLLLPYFAAQRLVLPLPWPWA